MTSMNAQSYLHGAAASEQRRLEVQSQLLGAAEFLPPVFAGTRILEVGCGTGAIARAVANSDPSIAVTGVDRESAQLETARQLAAAAGLSNLQFLQGDANHLDFAEGSFDAAYCRFLLEHVLDPLQVIQEMSRVVKPGGWVCVYEWEPDCFSIYPDSPAIEQLWREIYRTQKRLGGDPWVGRKLLGLFQQTNLKEIQVEGRVWTVTGQDLPNLQLYVNGAREIIQQATPHLLEAQTVTPALLQQAENEYQFLLSRPDAFVLHGFCRAVGSKSK